MPRLNILNLDTMEVKEESQRMMVLGAFIFKWLSWRKKNLKILLKELL